MGVRPIHHMKGLTAIRCKHDSVSAVDQTLYINIEYVLTGANGRSGNPILQDDHPRTNRRNGDRGSADEHHPSQVSDSLST